MYHRSHILCRGDIVRYVLFVPEPKSDTQTFSLVPPNELGA